MRKVLIVLSLLFLSPLAAMAEDGQDECVIDSIAWFTTGDNQQDESLCWFDWGLVGIQYDPAPVGSGAPGICIVFVELIGADDDRLDTLVMQEDGNAQVWVYGAWKSITELEEKILANHCALPGLV